MSTLFHHRFFIFLNLIGLLLYMRFVSIAQVNVQTFDAFCASNFDSQVTELPNEFNGAYYANLNETFMSGEPFVFSRYTSSNTQSLQPPIDENTRSSLRRPSISPDGRLMVFRSISASADLLLWDTETNDLTSLSLPSEIEAVFFQNNESVERDSQELIWIEPRQLRIQVFDDDSPDFRLLQYLDITISTTPLNYTLGQLATVDYPVLTLPSNHREITSYLSPTGQYLSVVSIVGFLEGNLRIYDLQTNNPVFEQEPNEIAYPVYDAPWWSPDGNTLIYIEQQLDSNGNFTRNTLVEVDILNNFQLNRTIDDAMLNSFGSSSSYLGLGNWSHNGEHFAFRMYDSSGTLYLVMYTPQTQQMRAYCDSNVPASRESVEFIWSPDNRFMGYWDLGRIFIVDTITGEAYRFPNSIAEPFVGWIETTPNISATSALSLINADTDTDIRALSTSSIEIIDIANNAVSIRSNTDPAVVGSVVFTVDGNVVATDNSAPYTIAGENGSDILSWNIALGQHTVVATPYSGTDGTGDAGTPLTVQVNIVDSSQSGLAVTSMTLINADTDTDIRSLLTSETDTINILTNGISIRANTSPSTVGSVRFALNGNANYRTENGAPYAIFTNTNSGQYEPWVVAPGNYTLTATPYSGSNGGGTAGTPLTVNFDIVNTPPSGSCTTTGGLVQEGEAGVRAGNFVVANDTIASGGQYVNVPEGTGSYYSPGSSSTVRFCFPVTDAGTYRLRAWVYSGDGGSDSFYVGYNGATIQWNTEINTIYSIGYIREPSTPNNSAQEYTLSSGNHEFTFSLREDGARLDKVELVNTVSNETVLYRVDAGATSAYTDTLGNVWSADSNFSGGSANSFSASILSTIEDPLYTTERSQSNNVGFSYSFPVSNGTYTVRLHFAEIWFVGGSGRGAIDSPSAQRRVFDVQIEGVTVLDEFHIVSETLQPRVAHVETFVVNVTDGTLNINFPPATTDNPTVEAIEIVQGG